MSDYINREMAADSIVLECDDVTLEQARRAIKDCPSADVVEVVRCKDCKYYHRRKNANPRYETRLYCNKGAYKCTEPTDYCSKGERKVDDKDYEQEILNARKGEE